MLLDPILILFLVSLFITLILSALLGLNPWSTTPPPNPIQIALSFLLVVSFFLTSALFIVGLFRIDPLPYVREGAYLMGLRQLISFADAIPENLQDNISVSDVVRLDTDGDEFREWVVFYEFDLRNGRNPVQGVVYDNDRGNPPVMFPYNLKAPNRDYLSETKPTVTVEQVTDRTALAEVVVHGDKELNIFEFRQNSEEWDFPRDAPARYFPVGFFRGSGGVTLDRVTKEVTVVDRDGFERSQLAIRSIFAINPRNGTYLDDFDPTRLAAPVVSTVDFFGGPPTDILGTTFPEKIVLAFYASTCGVGDTQTLCRLGDQGWSSQAFLAPTSETVNGEALTEFNNGNPAYFGLPQLSGVPNLSVTHLLYYPQLETDPDLLVEGGGRDVVTGEQGQENVVEISFNVNVGGSVTEQTLRYEMRLIDGQWKIVRRLPFDALPTLGTPTEISQ
ncbi:MAG: hypothetical protein R3264_09185 [Anaerolineae bacterium]|nr:hypothetical protein [Anaerolineae bacterium]